MNEEDLLDAIGYIEDDVLVEIEMPEFAEQNQGQKK